MDADFKKQIKKYVFYISKCIYRTIANIYIYILVHNKNMKEF